MGAATAMSTEELLGRLGRLGYGAAALGNLYASMDDDDAQRTLECAWEGGVRYFDTAPHYGLGLSEQRLGTFLQQKPRADYAISTKVGRLLEPNHAYRPGDKDAEGFDVEARLVRRWDYSEAGIRKSLQSSLERLGLNRVDILFLHDPDLYNMEAALAKAIPALQRLKHEGLASAIGVGSNSASDLAQLVEAADLDVVMVAGRFTLLEQPALERLLPLCLERGTSVVAAGVFNSGILADSAVPAQSHYNYLPAPSTLVERARRLARICQHHGVALPAAALQFPLRHRAIHSVAMGARGAQQMSSNLAAMSAAIPAALWKELETNDLIPSQDSFGEIPVLPQ